MTLSIGSIVLGMIFTLVWFLQRNYTLFVGEEQGLSQQVIEVIQKEQKLIELGLSIGFIITLLMIFTVSFFITRRLTEPVLSLQRQLSLYAEGDFTRSFRLRSRDEYRELEPLVNQIRNQFYSTLKSKKVSG